MIANHLHFKRDINTKSVFILQQAIELDKRLLKEYKREKKYSIYLAPIQRDKQGKFKATHRLSDSHKHITRLKEIEGAENIYIGDLENSEELLIIETKPNLLNAETLDIYVLSEKKPSTDKIEGLVIIGDIYNYILGLQTEIYNYNINDNFSSNLVKND